jgi:hypothetical protein
MLGTALLYVLHLVATLPILDEGATIGNYIALISLHAVISIALVWLGTIGRQRRVYGLVAGICGFVLVGILTVIGLCVAGVKYRPPTVIALLQVIIVAATLTLFCWSLGALARSHTRSNGCR